MGKKKESTGPVGGYAFFSSLIVLLFLDTLLLIFLPALYSIEAPSVLPVFFLSWVVGSFLAWLLVRGRFSVFIHEFKHSLVSGLVGNRAKKLRVRKSSGEFEYEYTAKTAPSNAFIALAPYCFPLCTIVSIAFAFLFRGRHDLAIVPLGIGYGADFLLNFRDVSPIQTDLTRIRGGFYVAVLYVLAMNAFVCGLVFAWAMQGVFGLKVLLYALWRIVTNIVAYYLPKTALRPPSS